MSSSTTPMPMPKTERKSLDELLQESRTGHPARHARHDEEHRIQCACVRWFRLQYPRLRERLFAVPNGGGRSKTEAAKLVGEGVMPGVSDLILLKPNRQYGALLIEMKTPSASSRQSQRQIWWQKAVTADGEYRYVVCRSLDDFMREVKEYLTNVL